MSFSRRNSGLCICHLFVWSIVIIIIIIILYIRELMVFHRSLNDSKSPQVSRTLLSILADLKNAAV